MIKCYSFKLGYNLASRFIVIGAKITMLAGVLESDV